jgi:tRNA threonylcarbamoyl adenosine modification protein (Sua5/YciO/YrdC/YwlC family)
MPTLEVSSGNPDDRVLKKAVAELKAGGIVVCPTDTFYAFTCALSNRSGIEEICKLIGKKPEKANLSIICRDLKNISDYTLQFGKSTYKLLNRNLPGPFTFILKANNRVPKLFLNNRKTIGIRVPDHIIPHKLVELLDEPLVAASVHHPGDLSEMLVNPQDIEDNYQYRVNMILAAEDSGTIGSAIIDCSAEEPVVVREGPLPVR